MTWITPVGVPRQTLTRKALLLLLLRRSRVRAIPYAGAIAPAGAIAAAGSSPQLLPPPLLLLLPPLLLLLLPLLLLAAQMASSGLENPEKVNLVDKKALSSASRPGNGRALDPGPGPLGENRVKLSWRV